MSTETATKKQKLEEPNNYPRHPMEGKPVPRVILKARKNGDWLDIDTSTFFQKKTVVVFSLPGAFTPTCSSTHLPRYTQLYSLFKANGVDEIVCISVNDGFVMESWGVDQSTEDGVKLWPDGNCEFTTLMGMHTDKSAIGFGMRSWRYSMLVKDGVINKIFSEPTNPGDPFMVSDAETMIKFINPAVVIPEPVVLFTKVGCAFCSKAKKLLQNKNLPFEEVVCGLGGSLSFAAISAVSSKTSTPQIFVGGKLIGGYEELEKHLGQ